MSTAVYVHFPWCLQKCPYCDFASASIRRPDVPHRDYAEAVLRELGWHARDARGSLGTLRSIFFGGGTPSLWAADELGRVVRAIKEAFAEHAEDLEVTVECNPSSLDEAHAQALAAQGVTRLSIGVQALEGERLRYLGRLHDDEGALRAVRAAQSAVSRVSADMMFGTPGQAPDAFLRELERLLELGLSHLSVYALTIEPNTQFGELFRKGRLPIAKEDDYADTFNAIASLLAERGFEHYEVSNYARADQHSRHNQHYWRGGDYLGLGCAAVGCRLTQPGQARRVRNQPVPERYLAARSLRDLCAESEVLDEQALIREALMLGLRTREGVNLQAVQERAGADLFEGRSRVIGRAIDRGNLLLEKGFLRVPEQRWLHLDGIVSDLF
jgi:putative oxygen-independent coproporphyrinogen III oxidase